MTYLSRLVYTKPINHYKPNSVNAIIFGAPAKIEMAHKYSTEFYLPIKWTNGKFENIDLQIIFKIIFWIFFLLIPLDWVANLGSGSGGEGRKIILHSFLLQWKQCG